MGCGSPWYLPLRLRWIWTVRPVDGWRPGNSRLQSGHWQSCSGGEPAGAGCSRSAATDVFTHPAYSGGTASSPSPTTASSRSSPLNTRSKKLSYDQEAYKQRNKIERFFNKLKHFRRIATRSNKLQKTSSPLSVWSLPLSSFVIRETHLMGIPAVKLQRFAAEARVLNVARTKDWMGFQPMGRNRGGERVTEHDRRERSLKTQLLMQRGILAPPRRT